MTSTHEPHPSALGVDLYQLTSLCVHHGRGLSDTPVTLTFFSRSLPEDESSGEPARAWLLWCGLERCLDYLAHARIDAGDLDRLCHHPYLGPALERHPDLIEKLRGWKFVGEVRAPREGTPLFCGVAVRQDGTPFEVDGVRPAAYTPYLVIDCDLLTAKLIETPLLSIINHMTMVATKASVITQAAAGRRVVEFGSRRTHPAAAVDAAVAAWIGGCAGTSNVEAWLRYGVPMHGTHDHFAIQAWEQEGVPRHETERAFFEAFHRMFAEVDTLLVDTYDTFGEKTGIHAAVAATNGDGPFGIRIDSNLNRDSLWRARRLLDGLGAIDTQIVITGGVDENLIAELGDAPVDGFGVGERLVTSADAPVGVGAVAKLSRIDGRPTTKLSRGSGKAHLPGTLQVWRDGDVDIVGLLGEEARGEPLLHTVWTREGRLPSPPLDEVRAYAQRALDALPESRRQPRRMSIPITDALAAMFTALVQAV